MDTKETRVYVALLASTLVLLFIIIFFILFIVQLQRERASFTQSAVNEHLGSLENTLTRISKDLHDDISSSLSAIKVRLQLVIPQTIAMQTQLDIAESQIDNVLEKVKDVSRNLVPPVLEKEGLECAIQELIEKVITPMGIQVTFSGTKVLADSDTQLQLYRITQEIFHNMLKHAQATHLYVRLHQDDDEMTLVIRDNGMGFNKNKLAVEQKGFGLKNIMDRVGSLRAKIYLTTSPGKGVEYLLKCKTNDKPNNQSNHRR